VSAPDREPVAVPVPVRARVAGWVRRYGPAEVVAVLTAVGGYHAGLAMGGGEVIAAYAGAIGENAGFYGVMLGREIRQAARQARAGGRPFGPRAVARTIGLLGVEFGVAEAFDSLLLRPLCMAIGVRWLGTGAGVIVGKLAADVTFYAPAIVFYELRRKYLEPSA